MEASSVEQQDTPEMDQTGAALWQAPQMDRLERRVCAGGQEPG